MKALLKNIKDIMARYSNRLCRSNRELNSYYKRVAIDSHYNLWLSKNEADRGGLGMTNNEMIKWQFKPKVSIIVPRIYGNDHFLSYCIESIIAQVYENWELWCLVDKDSDRVRVEGIASKLAKADQRVHIVVSSTDPNEVWSRATGEFMAYLDLKGILSPFALYEVVDELNKYPGTDFLYSDDDAMKEIEGLRYAPFFKPDWSPDTFFSFNYIGHFAVIRKSLIDQVGGLRPGYDGVQDYDLFLRIVQYTDSIRRIPKILYHSMSGECIGESTLPVNVYSVDAAKRSLRDCLSSQGIEAEIMDGIVPTSYRVRYKIKGTPKVSIIIPTRDKVSLLKQCVTSILNKTVYPNYEIMVVDNDSLEKKTLEYFELIVKNPQVMVIQYTAPFNFSAINNYSVRSSNAEYLLFLNNDTEIISCEWLTSMLEFAQRSDVGAVGAKLLYPNDTIQHAGVILGIGGVGNHAHLGFPRASHGYFGRINVIQNVSAVTGACMMVRRSVFDEVGGFDETLSHAFNDVDLCLKIRDKGYLIVYTPYAELYHHESASRGYEDTPEKQARFKREVEIVLSRWKPVFDKGDPYYNPNLTLEKCDFSFRT